MKRNAKKNCPCKNMIVAVVCVVAGLMAATAVIASYVTRRKQKARLEEEPFNVELEGMKEEDKLAATQEK